MTSETRERSHLYDKPVSIAEHLIFLSRWMLMPVKLGLMIALVVYVGRFFGDVWQLLVSSFSSDTEQMRVHLLGLVDTAMVANLIVMITLGGYQIFIRRPTTLHADERPQFLDHMDSGILKVKLTLSISGITLVQLLKDFVNIEHIEWTLVIHRMWVHGLTLLSAVVVAIVWRLTHTNDHPPAATAHAEH